MNGYSYVNILAYAFFKVKKTIYKYKRVYVITPILSLKSILYSIVLH